MVKSRHDDREYPVRGDPSKTDREMVVDEVDDNRYNINAGNATPQKGRCNCVLTKWKRRYGEKRYCAMWSKEGVCRKHKGRNAMKVQAQELSKTGMLSQSFIHAYDKMEPQWQALCMRLYEGYLDESVYDFDDTTAEKKIDFERHDAEKPDWVPDDEDFVVEVRAPANHIGRAIPLWRAAINDVKANKASITTLIKNMESETTTDSEFIMPTEDNNVEEERWAQLTEMSEHHLNLPLDRIERTQGDLLERGGVGVDEADVGDDEPTVTMELYDDPAAEDPIKPEAIHDLENSKPPVTTEDGSIPVEVES